MEGVADVEYDSRFHIELVDVVRTTAPPFVLLIPIQEAEHEQITRSPSMVPTRTDETTSLFRPVGDWHSLTTISALHLGLRVRLAQCSAQSPKPFPSIWPNRTAKSTNDTDDDRRVCLRRRRSSSPRLCGLRSSRRSPPSSAPPTNYSLFAIARLTPFLTVMTNLKT